ncbi:MAG: DUF3631 domain-containing protein [Spiribacter salinus]|uniref:DUF3631 domain-containing protein n=1 Tax=Spiribacter salinus TaxID=1335746 RepID=A0A540VTV9_9GAMM|nr:MAG: DUF3631 domain-containing protein [Spiribacter salinus]
MSDPKEAFRQAIRDAGLEPPQAIQLGKIQRFPGQGKPPGNDAGWCVLFEDCLGGCFGDWSTGLSETWQARRPADDAERKQWAERVANARRDAERQREQEHAEAARECAEIWRKAAPASPDHPYLTAKGINPHGAKIDGDRLVIPIQNSAGEIRSLQRIDSEGNKRFHPGGEISGNYYPIGKVEGQVVVAEGFATAASILQATGHAVVVAFNAGNLKPVAEVLRVKSPDIRIIVAADDDRKTEGNPGIAKATEAAQAVGGSVAKPGQPGDFNDLHAAEGPATVASAIEQAVIPPSDADAEVARLAKLDALKYDQVREAIARELGVRVSTLDREVKKARAETEATSATAAFDFEDPEPWPDPVDGAELLDEIEETVEMYAVTADHVPTAVSLWTLLSWSIDAARIAPILAITSPEKRCGKTTLLALLTRLVRKPLPASNITPAAVFRAIEKWTPTLLIDEADTFIRHNDELRGVLNSGHTRSNAFVIRTVGDDHEPRRFSTWGAKVVAMIGNLPDTLADRAIPVAMRRKLPSEKVRRLRGDPFEELKQRIARFASDHLEAIKQAEPEIPSGISDRAGDNWEPLLAIADQAGGGWPEKARTAALALSGAPAEAESIRTMLLADMRRLLVEHTALSSTDLADKLAEMEERPWPEFGKAGNPITPAKVARLVSGFDVRPEKLPSDSGYGPGTRGYTLEGARDAFARYLPPVQSANVPSANNHGGCGNSQSANEHARLAGSISAKLNDGRASGTLAPSNPSGAEILEVAREACHDLKVDPSKLAEFIAKQNDPELYNPAAVRRWAEVIEQRGFPRD